MLFSIKQQETEESEEKQKKKKKKSIKAALHKQYISNLVMFR